MTQIKKNSAKAFASTLSNRQFSLEYNISKNASTSVSLTSTGKVERKKRIHSNSSFHISSSYHIAVEQTFHPRLKIRSQKALCRYQHSFSQLTLSWSCVELYIPAVLYQAAARVTVSLADVSFRQKLAAFSIRSGMIRLCCIHADDRNATFAACFLLLRMVAGSLLLWVYNKARLANAIWAGMLSFVSMETILTGEWDRAGRGPATHI